MYGAQKWLPAVPPENGGILRRKRMAAENTVGESSHVSAAFPLNLLQFIEVALRCLSR